MSFDPTLIGYSPNQTEQFYKTLINQTRAVPGVKSAALTRTMPMGSNLFQEAVIPEGYQFPKGKQSVDVLSDTVDHHYFETFGVPILRGRGFLASDRADSSGVAVVSEAFASRYLGQNPIGKRLRLSDQNNSWVEVVGVAANSKYIFITLPPTEFLYLPLSQHPQARMTLLAQSYGDPEALAAPLREMVRSIDSNLPVFGMRTMSDLFNQRSIKILNLLNGVVAAVGAAGLGLALVGLYAVVAYQVARRTREIGIRMALGAGRPAVIKMIVKQAAVMGVSGVCIGLVFSIAGNRALSGSLVEVPAADPLLFSLILVGVLLTTLLAAAIPAQRAARVDPIVALRQD
jgi:predicted permease